MGVLELEGTWEEILKRSAELSGRRVKVTVLPNEHAEPSQEELHRRVQKWLDEVEKLEPGPPGPPLRGQEAEYEQILIEKFRKQGFKF